MPHEFQSVENLQHTPSRSDENTDFLFTTIAFPKLHIKGLTKEHRFTKDGLDDALANSAGHKE